MFTAELFLALLWSATGGLLSLLGSTGIFVSLVVQRRIERLQDILEEFLELPYHENKNLAAPMVSLVRKYQVHYLFPDRPGRTILFYLDFTLLLIGLIWLWVLLMAIDWPFRPLFWFQGVLLLLIGGNMFLFRRLLQQTISPTGNPLFNPIIPPPERLRSVSYLSRYVNVSVKSMLQQARFALALTRDGELRLKQEVSFDDFYYLLHCPIQRWLAWGELRLTFPPDPITGKPVPLQRNVEIPLGRFASIAVNCDKADGGVRAEANVCADPEGFPAILYVFPAGEKHPIQLEFELRKEEVGYHSRPFPEMTVQSAVLYRFEADRRLEIIEDGDRLAAFQPFRSYFICDRERYFCPLSEPTPRRCSEPLEVR
ncbi:hypothetical protein GTO89_13205 [Heliobacterium gestii]|uniref:Uncharacterized protein n=1 Tax=Heliomicrobium gestii TaxID=2699 RepID=A0A845LG89_HELGE|nr:hypothetical protein [Heliomicrobium gestii]MBM7867596.1 hypothetical protein [Heliomicrobium gestii]MZP43990.1 hypothetical protein [Heliomicrobium gestii]